MDFDFGYSFGLPSVLSPFARLIPTFDGTPYGTIDTAITFTGDFDIEVIAATTVAANSNISALFGRSGSTTDYAQLQNTAGKLTFVTDDGTVDILKTDHLDGKLHTYNFKRVGNTISIDFDGAEVATNTLASASTVTIGLIAALFTTIISQQFNGQILSAKFTDAGTIVDDFVFDSGSTADQPSRGGGNNVSLTNFATTDWNRYTSQRNISHDAGTIAEAWVGDNLVVNGGFNADTDWVKGAGWSIGSGVATHATPNANKSIKQTINLLSGVSLLGFDIPRFVSGSLVPYLGGTFDSGATAIGIYNRVIAHGVTPSTIELFSSAGSDFDGDLDNVSVRKLLEVA